MSEGGFDFSLGMTVEEWRRWQGRMEQMALQREADMHAYIRADTGLSFREWVRERYRKCTRCLTMLKGAEFCPLCGQHKDDWPGPRAAPEESDE